LKYVLSGVSHLGLILSLLSLEMTADLHAKGC